LKEIIRLVGRFNLKPKEKVIKAHFKEVDVDKSGELDYDEFQVFLERLRVRPEILEVWDKYLGGEVEHMKENDLIKFCQSQHDTIDVATAKKIIAECENKAKDGSPASLLYTTGFSNFLGSPRWNSIFNPANEKVYQDMTQPFAHYFLASSHNTYALTW
jgi:phosphatidylinositol phospholipase C delta